MRKLTVTLVAATAALLLTPTFAAEPIATVETNWDGISIDVMALERKGSVLTLKWAVRNDGQASTRVEFTITGKNVRTYVVDEESGTNWLQETGKAIEGDKVGLSLPKLDADEWESKIRWDEWKRTHPESKVLYCDHCENQ